MEFTNKLKMSEKGQGLVEYTIIMSLVALCICGVGGLLIYKAWPWIVSTAWPWFIGVIAGVMAGNPASIAALIVIVLVVLWLLRRGK